MSASYHTPVKPFKSSTLFGGTQSEDAGALKRAPSSPPVKTKIKYSHSPPTQIIGVSIRPVVLRLLCDYFFRPLSPIFYLCFNRPLLFSATIFPFSLMIPSDQWSPVFYVTLVSMTSGSAVLSLFETELPSYQWFSII
ncbi:hypothetical protein CEXT_506381 [Caerostris extrusa]|uniref:Uncharacterized protein n=1 Tax=Caerostris extrusa TaxID=172846 RepID=A0AAV4RTV7_CAEEX|nr:hypothetical protein CEXT_506381 [Caerostris extrusa]